MITVVLVVMVLSDFVVHWFVMAAMVLRVCAVVLRVLMVLRVAC